MMKYIIPLLIISYAIVSCQSESRKNEENCKEIQLEIDKMITSSNDVYAPYEDPNRLGASSLMVYTKEQFNSIDNALNNNDQQMVKKGLDNLYDEHSRLLITIKAFEGSNIVGFEEEFQSQISELSEFYKTLNFNLYPELNIFKTRSLELRVLLCLNKYLSFRPFQFNKCEPLVVSESENNMIRVYTVAYDSTELSKVQYWIDDSLMLHENRYFYEGMEGGFIDLPELTKGSHIIYGNKSVMIKGIETWQFFKYEMEVE